MRGHLAGCGDRQESFGERLPYLVVVELGRHGASDERPATANDRESDASGRRTLREQPFFRSAALPPQRMALRQAQRPIYRAAELGLDERGQGKIDVIATEQQVLTDRHPLESGLALVCDYPNQREVRRAPADVAHQRDLIVTQLAARRGVALRKPGVKRRQRLFEKCQPLETSQPGGFDRELARFFIKRSWHREDDRLLFEAQSVGAA